MSRPARSAEESFEALGFLACALFVGLLFGWMAGAYSTARYAPDCVERAQ